MKRTCPGTFTEIHKEDMDHYWWSWLTSISPWRYRLVLSLTSSISFHQEVGLGVRVLPIWVFSKWWWSLVTVSALPLSKLPIQQFLANSSAGLCLIWPAQRSFPRLTSSCQPHHEVGRSLYLSFASMFSPARTGPNICWRIFLSNIKMSHFLITS